MVSKGVLNIRGKGLLLLIFDIFLIMDLYICDIFPPIPASLAAASPLSKATVTEISSLSWDGGIQPTKTSMLDDGWPLLMAIDNGPYPQKSMVMFSIVKE